MYRVSEIRVKAAWGSCNLPIRNTRSVKGRQSCPL